MLCPKPQSELSGHIFKFKVGKSPVCQVAGLGVKKHELETRPTDAMVCGTGDLLLLKKRH